MKRNGDRCYMKIEEVFTTILTMVEIVGGGEHVLYDYGIAPLFISSTSGSRIINDHTSAHMRVRFQLWLLSSLSQF